MQKKYSHAKIFLISLFFLLVSCSRETLPQGVQKLQTNHQRSQPNQIEVLEFLWLGCPQCLNFHKDWADLKKQFDDEVLFRNIPAMFNNWIFDARVYVTMEELGLINDGLLANYYEVRQGPDKLKFAKDIRAVAQWLAQRYGVREQDFLNMFDSPLMEERLQDIQELTRQYPVTGVPAILISEPNRKVSYLIQGNQSAATKKIIHDLINRLLLK